MCVVSMVSDWGRGWTNPFTPQPGPSTAGTVPDAGIFWNIEMLRQFQELLKKVQEIEDKLNVEPCVDPTKQEFLEDIEATLTQHEYHDYVYSMAPGTFQRLKADYQCKHCGLKQAYWGEGECPARTGA